ncbi:unnamed protein product [Cylicocyclus nassatus]|uniref:Uncharacterized protein n=1 Tax=Cylicocyclus nassatus TaxID=53992 RepID=A0AA36DJ50_CYLNA|nr:unnamed protein product [Cylicocyclus nassatus]
MQLPAAIAVVIPLLVTSLQCYVGSEGDNLTKEEGFVCAYETKKPCKFEVYGVEKRNFRTASFISTEQLLKCDNRNHRAICYCNSDLCNGSFKSMLEKWKRTYHPIRAEYDCVIKHLKQKEDLPLSNKASSVAEELRTGSLRVGRGAPKQIKVVAKRLSSGEAEEPQKVRCYVGFEDAGLEGLRKQEITKNQMCAYETKQPCLFAVNTIRNSLNFRVVPLRLQHLKECYSKDHRAICFCRSDLCNGSFRYLKSIWEKTSHTSQMEHRCVSEHLGSKKDLPHAAIKIEETLKQDYTTQEPEPWEVEEHRSTRAISTTVRQSIEEETEAPTSRVLLATTEKSSPNEEEVLPTTEAATTKLVSTPEVTASRMAYEDVTQKELLSTTGMQITAMEVQRENFQSTLGEVTLTIPEKSTAARESTSEYLTTEIITTTSTTTETLTRFTETASIIATTEEDLRSTTQEPEPGDEPDTPKLTAVAPEPVIQVTVEAGMLVFEKDRPRKSTKRRYNWTIFIILSVIAGILVFVAIPAILILTAMKYKQAKKEERTKSSNGKRYTAVSRSEAGTTPANF